MLATGALLLGRSFLALAGSDFGFDARRVLTLEAPQNNRSVEEARSFYARALERIRALPGVESAAGVFLRPLWSTIGFDGIYVAEGQTDADGETNPHVNVESITPGYFEAMAHPARRRPRLHRRRRRAFVRKDHRQREPCATGVARRRGAGQSSANADGLRLSLPSEVADRRGRRRRRPLSWNRSGPFRSVSSVPPVQLEVETSRRPRRRQSGGAGLVNQRRHSRNRSRPADRRRADHGSDRGPSAAARGG